MRLPVIRGLIDRRILVNYRVRPDVLERLIPSPFRLKLVNGWGIAGVCLIRLKHIRPTFLPAPLGISSENAAHRIAVEWDQNGETKTAVFIPRRVTSSPINALLGGRVFPGMTHPATFQVDEHDDTFRVELTSNDRQTHFLVQGTAAEELPRDSVFGSLSEASRFFEQGAVGYSVTNQPGQYDGLELRSLTWHMRPLEVKTLKSSYFENPEMFPAGSIDFDSALLMQGIEHEWHGRDCLCV